MICPNCEEHFESRDYADTKPFQCEHCGQWLEFNCNGVIYKDVVNGILVMLDEEDLE
ncbi:hypothetical protein JCM17795_16010 [Galenea microaerophila]